MQTEAFLPSTTDFSFKKSERLCSKKAFEFLFAKGKSTFLYPIKIIYVQEIIPDQSNVQVAFGVSKRNFKKAVDRNKLKRILREIYRKNKIHNIPGINQYLMIIYISKDIDSFNNINDILTKALKQLSGRIEKYF